MLLRLTYSENHHAPVNATIIPGGNAYTWLAEISNWDVDLRVLRCFVLPESIGSTETAGLFVIFQHESIASKLSLRTAYTAAAPDFYIPVHSVLSPAVTAAELTQLKLWDVQIFHPSAGLIGFENKDELRLTDLVSAPKETGRTWLTIKIPQQPYPRLNSIRLEAEETPFDPNTLIEQLPLDGIPDSDAEQHTPFKKILRFLTTILLYFILILAAIGKIIVSILQAFFGRRFGRTSPYAKKGIFQRLNDWVNSRLKDLSKQRDSELNRLVKLFDKNEDDALQYAIPLNSPYLNRGTAAPSGKLTRRSTNFNLGRLGGGGRVDYWDLGDYRMTLRQQYIKALNAAIEKGDYKKAAYIHAHLLGDLGMAAQTLQNGKHYREAAAIYKDHLNNRAKAAECLEKGGLLTEAIPIHVDLGNYEKAADLHVQLGQSQLASKYYEDTVKRSLDAKDYLNAARLKGEKMDDPEAAKTILLNGWKDDNQPEICLKKYFEFAQEENLPAEIRTVYERHVTLRKKTNFLNVLADITAGHKDERLRQNAIDISYEIIHQQVKRGDQSGLRMLHRFLPNDRLLAQDASRYILQNHQKTPLIAALSYIQLRQDTKWTIAVNYHDQFIAIGTRNSELHLVRGSWEGKTAYELLFLLTGMNPFYRLIADAQVSSQVYLTGNAVPARNHKEMPAFSFFEKAFDFEQLHWQLPHTLAYGQKSQEENIFILHSDGDHLCLDLFSLDGSLLQKNYCLLNGDKISLQDIPFLPFSSMYWRKDHFYLIALDRLIRIDAKGELEMFDMETDVFAFSISGAFAALKLALLTAKGCLLLTPGIKDVKISAPVAEDIDARFVQLLADNRLILASETTAFVYDISTNIPKLIAEIQPENSIIQILTVPKRHHFALLESDNRISIHRLEEEL